MSNFTININHDWKCNEVFANADDAIKYLIENPVVKSAFIIREISAPALPEKTYSVFANKEWLGPPYKTVDEAIKYAKALGLTCFGIYPNGSNKITECVYEEDDGEDIKSILKMVLLDPVNKWLMLPRAGMALPRLMKSYLERLAKENKPDVMREVILDELRLAFTGSYYDPNELLKEIDESLVDKSQPDLPNLLEEKDAGTK